MELGTVGNVAAANVQRSFDSVQVSQVAQSNVTAQGAVQTANAVQQTVAPPSMEQVKQAVDEINKSMAAAARGLQFTIDDDTDKTVVKVIDKQTHEVIRQIPSEETLAIAKSIEQAIGNLIQQKA